MRKWLIVFIDKNIIRINAYYINFILNILKYYISGHKLWKILNIIFEHLDNNRIVDRALGAVESRNDHVCHDIRNSYSVVTLLVEKSLHFWAHLCTVEYYCTTLMTWRRVARQQRYYGTTLLNGVVGRHGRDCVMFFFLSRFYQKGVVR